MDKTTIVDRIVEAFPTRPLPQMSLHQGQLADQSLSREIGEREWQAASALDVGRAWDMFTDAELISCDAALSHLDEAAFVYYLPAFLLLALRHLDVEWNHPAWATTGMAIFAITDRSAYSLSRFSQLSTAQVQAIKYFLEFVAHGTSSNARLAQLALNRYWNTDRAGKLLIVPRRSP